MAKAKQKDPFWTSYSDLMTSLFFVMLVLFIICMVKVGGSNMDLKEKQGELEHLLDSVKATNEQLKNILQLEEQFKVLSKSTSLEYDEERKMFYAKDFQNKEIFFPNQYVIDPQYEDIVDRVGREILGVLQSLNEYKDFKYQMVIEGNAAIKWENLKSGNYNPDDVPMYQLSYNRALTLYKRWLGKGIDFRKYNTEVIIAGSGFNGINRDQKVEDYNKRFIIQIIPKINRPNTTDSTNE
jgi:hypothetical protein